jgi:hypothetical protein
MLSAWRSDWRGNRVVTLCGCFMPLPYSRALAVAQALHPETHGPVPRDLASDVSGMDFPVFNSM